MNTNTLSHGRYVLVGLRDARMARQLTQAELADKAGVAESSVVRAEQRKAVYGATARRLAAVLRVTLDQLCGEPSLRVR